MSTLTTRTEEETTDDQTAAETGCPNCDNGTIVSQDAERYCNDCGAVIEEEQIDHGPEWRAFNSNEYESKARTGAPSDVSKHDKGLSTKISWQDRDANGNAISSEKKRQMSRLRRWDEHSRTKSSKERNLKKALTEIHRMTSALGLPDNVKDTASVIYRQAVDNELLIGRSIEGVATASLYCACRHASVPRTLFQVSNVSRMDKSTVSSAYRYLSNELGLELPPASPTEFIPAVASNLDVSNQVRSEAENILRAYAEAGEHSGRDPKGAAAASIYCASQILSTDSLTQQEAANAGDVCVVTIRTRHTELKEYDDAIESDPHDITANIDADLPDISTDTIEMTELDSKDSYAVTVPDNTTQNEVLLTVVDKLINDFDLLNEIEVPYSPGSWSNDALVNDPDTEAEGQKASWDSTDNGIYANTKICKSQKTRLLNHLAQKVGITLRITGDW